VLPIVFERYFQTWSFGVGHAQLVLLSRAKAGDEENVVVHFEGIRAMELRSSYRPLVVDLLDEPRRGELIAWAGIPDRLRDRFLYLSVSSGTPRGYVVCGRVTVLAAPADEGHRGRPLVRPPGSRVLHSIRPCHVTPVERGESPSS
jgi:hypothetical protein